MCWMRFLELQQLLAGSGFNFTEFVLYEAWSATRFTRFVPYGAEAAVKLKVEPIFDFSVLYFVLFAFFRLLCVMLGPHLECAGILYVGFLAEDSAPSMASVPIPI